MKKRVLVLGASKRVQGAILPALWCLGEGIEIAGVLARSVRPLSLFGDRLRISTLDSLEAIDFRGIDLVMLAVSQRAVAGVLADLSRFPVDRVVLMLDTPVLPLRRIDALRHLRRFRRALVSEDTIALPPFVLARRLIEEGRIGRLKTIHFFHNGYKHHALASLRFLSGGATIRRIASRRYPKGRTVKEIRFGNGTEAVLFEPRDYEDCKFLIEGERGAIADFDFRPEVSRVAGARADFNAQTGTLGPGGGSLFRIGYRIEDGVYKGLTLDGDPLPTDALDEAYARRIPPDVPGLSVMKGMKIRGLMSLVEAAAEESSPLHYSVWNGLRDSVEVKWSDGWR
jgi:predicted dehydrogenase